VDEGGRLTGARRASERRAVQPYRLRCSVAWNHARCWTVPGVFARTLLDFTNRHGVGHRQAIEDRLVAGLRMPSFSKRGTTSAAKKGSSAR